MNNKEGADPQQPETKVGRPKRREVIVSNIAESMGMQLAADVLTLEEMEGFPQIQNESPRNQAIMALVASGFSQSHIAEIFGIKQPSVCELIGRIDPHGMFKLDKKARKAVVTKLAESRAMSAISSISYTDLLDLDADKRANVAQKMMKISQDLNATKHQSVDAGKLDMMLASLETAEVVESVPLSPELDSSDEGEGR